MALRVDLVPDSDSQVGKREETSNFTLQGDTSQDVLIVKARSLNYGLHKLVFHYEVRETVQVSSMIPSASPTVSPIANIFSSKFLFCFMRF